MTGENTPLELAGAFDLAMVHILASKKVLLVSPEDPDPDSWSSILGFREFIRWLGETSGQNFECHLYAPNKPRPNTLYGAAEVFKDPSAELKTTPPDDYDLCVIFDHGAFWRTHLVPKEGVFYLCFDHHPKESGFPENGLEIIDEAPSTTELLYRFFRHHQFPVIPEVATCLFVGLMADTGFLSNDLTGFAAYQCAAELAALRADIHKVIASSRPSITLRRFRVRQKAREYVQFFRCGMALLSFSLVDLRTWGGTQEDVLSLFSELLSLEEARFVAIHYQRTDGSWYCSLRSSSKKGVVVQKIAEQFGGKGHQYAAAFTTQEKSSEEMGKKLIKALAVLN